MNCRLKDRLLAKLAKVGQEHLLAFWDELSDEQRRRLASQIEGVDFDRIARLYDGPEAKRDWATLADRIAPPEAMRLDGRGNRFSREEARRRGEEALRAGKIGAILVAGGQGTRLNFEHPKGMFEIGPISGRSLFQMHADCICAVVDRYGARVPLYLMTSPATHDETVAFFNEHDRFGLPADDLVVFCQGTMPAVDAETGRLLLSKKDSLALSPDGHGGTLAALDKSGSLEDIRRRGVEHLFYFQVDNPFVAVCDPELIGYHLLAGSEMTTQVVAKSDPFEKVGNVLAIDGRLEIVEYIHFPDLPDEVTRKRNADGSLRFWAGSIAVHVFDVGLLCRMAPRPDVLPFHRARKKVKYVDAGGHRINPAMENAIQFERFIFDLLPHARDPIVVEVDPAEGFAPVKNADDRATDTPETAQAALIARDARRLKEAGATVADGVAVEINPRYALDAAELAARIEPGLQVNEPKYFV